MNIREAVIEGIKAKGINVVEEQVHKNGCITDALILGDGKIRPILYIENFINLEKPIENIVDEIITGYKEAAEQDVDVNTLTDKGFILENICIELQQRSTDDSILKRETPYEGIEAVLVVNSIQNDMQVSMKINKTTANYIGLTEDALWKIAECNTFEKTNIYSIIDFIANGNEKERERIKAELGSEPQVYVVSNFQRYKGAAAILDKKKIKALGQRDGFTKFWAIPCNVHKFIIQPYSDEFTQEIMNSMVENVNFYEVPPIEQLSNRAYLVDMENWE